MIGPHMPLAISPPTSSPTRLASRSISRPKNNMLYANTATGFRPDATWRKTSSAWAISAITNICRATARASSPPIRSRRLHYAGAGNGRELRSAARRGEASTATTRNVCHPARFPLTAYEAGIKNRFLDNRLQVNLSGYYYKFQSLFIQSLGVNDVNQSQNILQNQKPAR